MPSLSDFRDLTPPQTQVLERLERELWFTDCFYFTGGTLLKALGIVPRTSNDLDFFTFSDVPGKTYNDAVRQVRSVLVETFGREHVLNTERGFLLRRVGMTIECIYDTVDAIDSFVHFGHLRTAGLRDATANKVAAFCVRDEVKDYIDIAFLTKRQEWLLKDLADIAEEKFQLHTFNEEKLFTELVAKRDALTIPPNIFLRNAQEHLAFVQEQGAYLLEHTTL